MDEWIAEALAKDQTYKPGALFRLCCGVRGRRAFRRRLASEPGPDRSRASVLILGVGMMTGKG